MSYLDYNLILGYLLLGAFSTLGHFQEYLRDMLPYDRERYHTSSGDFFFLAFAIIFWILSPRGLFLIRITKSDHEKSSPKS